MIEKFACVLATIIAACLVMILHEIPKTIIYKIRVKKKQPKVNIVQFIDPVGLIFAVVGYCGFSKPYAYHVRDKKTNLWIGYVGMITLIFLFLVTTLGCKYIMSPFVVAYAGTGTMEYVSVFLFWIVQYMGVVSVGMFFVNLFPIVPFNMGNLIAGYSTSKLLSILKSDYELKMLYFLAMIFGIIKKFSVQIFLFLYNM